jgi:hypothetical protein
VPLGAVCLFPGTPLSRRIWHSSELRVRVASPPAALARPRQLLSIGSKAKGRRSSGIDVSALN